MACQLNRCVISIRGTESRKVILGKLSAAGFRKRFLTPADQFINDAIANDNRALVALEDAIVIEMNHEGAVLNWNGHGQRVDKQLSLRADITLYIDESVKRYFLGLLEGLHKPGTDIPRKPPPPDERRTADIEGDMKERNRAMSAKNEVVPEQEQPLTVPGDKTVQDGAAFHTIGKTLVDEVLLLCDQEKVKRLAKDIGFKGEFKRFEEEYLYLVMFLQSVACEISFRHDMFSPILDNSHQIVYETKLGLPSKAVKTGHYEAGFKTRYHQYHELIQFREGKPDTSVLLAELPYYFLACALNKSIDEASYFISRQKLCTNLRGMGFQILKIFIGGLLSSCHSTIDSLLERVEEKQGAPAKNWKRYC